MDSLTCVEKLLGNSSLSSDQNIIDSVYYIFHHPMEFHRHTNFSKHLMDDFYGRVLPCILNITNDNLRSSKPEMIGAVLSKIKLLCVIDYCPDTGCYDVDLDAVIFWIMMVISIIMLAITCMFRKRRNCCIWCCWGRPGPVIPLNMLDATDDRRGVAITFGLTATKCINVLFGDYGRLFGEDVGKVIDSWPSYTSVFVKFVCTILISQLAYPFFICQHMRNKLLGAIIGLLLCLTWFTLKMIKIYVISETCLDFSVLLGIGKNFGAVRFIKQLPFYICLWMLAVKFGFIIFTALKKSWQHRNGVEIIHWTDHTDWKTKYTYKHVRNLFKVKVLEEVKVLDDNNNYTFIEKVKRKLISKLYASDYDFRYSTRMLSSFLVAFLAVVNIAATLCTLGYAIFHKGALSITLQDRSYIARLLGTEIKVISYYIHGAGVSWFLACAGGVIFSTAVLLHSLTLYRTHYLKLRRGDRSFLPESMKDVTADCPGALMNASMRSAGYQVGYSAWGFIINFIVLFLICLLLHTQVVCAIKFKEITLALKLLKSLWPTLLVTVAMIIAQKFIASMFFLRDPDTLAVDNRRVYHIFVYYTFFFNIFLGLISCLLRILYGILFGFIFLQRLQKSTLPHAYQEMDSGYFAYMSYLLVEHQHANLVLRVFTSFLLQSQDMATEWKIDDIYGEGVSANHLMKREFGSPISGINEAILRKKRAIIRWHLYVVLLANPSLRKFRKSYQKQRFNMRNNAELLNAYKADAKCKKTKDCDNDDNDAVKEVEKNNFRRVFDSKMENPRGSLEEASLMEVAKKDVSNRKVLLKDIASHGINIDSILLETVKHPDATTDLADEAYVTDTAGRTESNISLQTENENVITPGTKCLKENPDVEFV